MASATTHTCPRIARPSTTPASTPAPASDTWIRRSLVNSRQDVPIETMTLATRNVLMTKYVAAPSATAATWPAPGGPDGTAMVRLSARATPAAMSTWPTLNADLTAERLRPAWARTVARPRVPRVTSGGTSRARITKKASSMLRASDSRPR